MRVEHLRVLKTKGPLLESIAYSDTNLNFRRGLAHELAQKFHSVKQMSKAVNSELESELALC